MYEGPTLITMRLSKLPRTNAINFEGWDFNIWIGGGGDTDIQTLANTSYNFFLIKDSLFSLKPVTKILSEVGVSLTMKIKYVLKTLIDSRGWWWLTGIFYYNRNQYY